MAAMILPVAPNSGLERSLAAARTGLPALWGQKIPGHNRTQQFELIIGIGLPDAGVRQYGVAIHLIPRTSPRHNTRSVDYMVPRGSPRIRAKALQA